MSSYPASSPLPAYRTPREDDGGGGGAGFKVAALLLGFLVGVLAIVAVWLGATAQSARDDAQRAAANTTSMPGMAIQTGAAGATATPSYAGIAPANADALAMQHTAFPAALAPAPAGPVASVNLAINHETVQIAPGIKYEAWTFGSGVPGPVIHVRQGQLVKVTMRNTSPMPHSIDFHAARVAPNAAFVDIAPGKSFTFQFRANDPGVYMYHCGTKPVLAHIANGMYGAIIVEPKNLPRADRQYVLVSSEWYLNGPGTSQPAALDMVKAHEMQPDWVTWNGYAAQYKTHPLAASPGETVRFWVVAAGPSLDTDFHVVGTVFDRAWVNADLRDAPQHGIQTALVPAGGGGVFDVRIAKPGLYPFVSHSFASVDMGQVGLLNVGGVQGTMSH